MSVTRVELERLREQHPSLKALNPSKRGPIDYVLVEMTGKRGGKSGWLWWGPNATTTFGLLLDVRDLASGIPDAWVLSPEDEEIRHCNIFRSKPCPVVGKARPKVCWGDFAAAWAKAPREQRRLGAALDYLRQLLNNQNLESIARIPE